MYHENWDETNIGLCGNNSGSCHGWRSCVTYLPKSDCEGDGLSRPDSIVVPKLYMIMAPEASHRYTSQSNNGDPAYTVVFNA